MNDDRFTLKVNRAPHLCTLVLDDQELPGIKCGMEKSA